MKRIAHLNGSLVTGDDVADGVLEYARQVVAAGASVTVSIPTLQADGSVAHHGLLIGPATQLEVSPFEGEPDGDRFPMPVFAALIPRALPIAPDELPEYHELS
jgi:hypothetical protein